MSHTSSGPTIMKQLISPLHKIQAILVTTKKRPDLSITPKPQSRQYNMYPQQQVVSRHPRGCVLSSGKGTSFRKLAYTCENQVFI